MKKLELSMVLLISLFLITCSKDSPTKSNGDLDDYNPNGHWDQPYFLGENFSNKWDPSISGDGKTLYIEDGHYNIYYSTLTDNGWSSLTKFPYEGDEPCISYDGKTLYFSDNGKIYKSIKSGNNWSQPTYLIDGEEPTVTQDDKIMFYNLRNEEIFNKIQYAELDGNNWIHKGGISAINALGSVSDPSISGDGTLLFFVSGTERYDIFCSTQIDGIWQNPSILPSAINFATENYCPCISWNKRTLYYATCGSHLSPGTYVSHWINE